MDQIRSALERLAELSGEELDKLLDDIVTEFESVDTQELSPQVVDSMTELATALDTVKQEKSRREEELAELSRRRDEAAAAIKGNRDETVAESVEVEVDAATEASAEATPAETESSAVTELATEEVVEETTPTELATEEVVAEATETVTELATAVVDEAPAEEATTEEAEAVAEVVEETEAVVAEESPEAVTADAGAEAHTDEENPGKDPEAPVTAAADQGPDVQAPADRQPKAKTSATVAITAGADIPGVSAGSDLPNMRAIAEAMTKRMHGMRNVSGGDGEQHTVATLVASYPEDRVLRMGDVAGNQQKIEGVTSPQAITAAGGFCAPVEVTYDILGFGVTDRPVKDALASFQADRGGIQWTNAPVLGDIPTTEADPPAANSAISLWTKEMDAAATAGTPTKPSFRIECGTTSTAYLDAIPMQLTVGNLVTRAYPELVEANNNLALVTFARYAETRLLTRIGSLSTQVTAAAQLGAARDFFNQVDRAAVAYRQRHRMNPTDTLRVIAPMWIKNMMRADLVMQMPGASDEYFAMADSKINSWFSARNVNPSWTLDGEAGQVFGAQNAGALLDYPGTVVWYLFAEGTFLFLDGGTLDLGLVRDSSLNATNDYKIFVETFEAVAKRGIESLRVESTLNVNGATAGTIDPATL